MRLIRAHVRNFKLLEDVKLEFSTKYERPLTMIRAENASGKTSLLYAFQWAFYGMAGLPTSAKSLRLTSTSIPSHTATTVSVTIEFETEDEHGNVARYRLIRSVTETPTAEDAFERQPDRVRLLRILPTGEEDIEAAESTIWAWLPMRLKDVFFTDGDSVQTFISGQIGARERQNRVQNAIRDLLGIEKFQTAADDIEAVFRTVRAEAAKSGGRDMSNLERALEETNAQIRDLKADRDKLRDRQVNMKDQRTAWEKELRGLRGIGDIDELNERIGQAEEEQVRLERQRLTILGRMQDALKSEEFSWHYLDERLRNGLQVLSKLADLRIIPGASVEVLADRLELNECVCGQSLAPGSDHRGHVERLLAEQRDVSANRQRLTGLSHLGKRAEAGEQGRRESRRAFSDTSTRLLQEFTEAGDSLRAKGHEIDGLKGRRNSINEEHVRDLASRLDAVEGKIVQVNQDIGAREVELKHAEERQIEQERELKEAQRKAAISSELALKRDIAEDLTNLVRNVLGVLQGDYVGRVSTRMRELFMEIVGTPDDPVREDFGPELYTGVHIDDEHNIVVDTHDNKRLDPDFELSGASKRALTLSFIWALMEVSGATVPRMIDTPLGMVSGGVKFRMVDAITKPPTNGHPSFQVILFLTRAELRDVEELIDERAGASMTLTCSTHYPVDLIYLPGTMYPISRICSCDHRHSCRICARHYDERHGILFRDTTAVAQ